MEKQKRLIAVGEFVIDQEEKRLVNQVLESGRISEGKMTQRFERMFRDYIGVKHCVAVNSGTSALIAGFLALLQDKRFKKAARGARVITTPLTYVADANAIVLAGMEPVFVDVDPLRFSILPELIEAKVKELGKDNVAIVLPVHLMGYMCDMDRINSLADRNDLVVFEDSAQAHGSLYHGKKAGSLATLAAFSFYIAHNIQAGEMGALTTSDDLLYKNLKKIKANGRDCDCEVCSRKTSGCVKPGGDKELDYDPRFSHSLIGANFKTMEFQSALGVAQMEKADRIFVQRQKNVKYLNEKLAEYGDLFILPEFSGQVSYLAYPIILKKNKKLSRRSLRLALEAAGVETRPLFACIPTQVDSFKSLKNEYAGQLPNAEYLGENAFYVGCHQYLTEDDLDYMVAAFTKIIKGI